jgi:hypothetical protein
VNAFFISVRLLFVSNFIVKFGGIPLFPLSYREDLTALHHVVKRTFFLRLPNAPLFFMNFHEKPALAASMLFLFFLPALLFLFLSFQSQPHVFIRFSYPSIPILNGSHFLIFKVESK